MGVQALEVGELQLSSFLGQRLSASIALRGNEAVGMSASCFSPYHSEESASSDLPWLSQYVIKLRQDSQGPDCSFPAPNPLTTRCFL